MPRRSILSFSDFSPARYVAGEKRAGERGFCCSVCWKGLHKIILIEYVTDVGKKGQLLDVKARFYRNFLQPSGKARIVTTDLIKEMKVEEEIIEAEKKLSLIDLLFVTMVAHSKVCRLVTIPFARKNEGLKRGLQSVDSSDYPMIESVLSQGGRRSLTSLAQSIMANFCARSLNNHRKPSGAVLSATTSVLMPMRLSAGTMFDQYYGGVNSLIQVPWIPCACFHAYALFRDQSQIALEVRSNKCFFVESSNYKQEGGWITSVEIKPITKSIVRWNSNHKVDGRNPVNYSYGILLLEAITGRNPVNFGHP
ncbi:50S ribosomal protein L9, chloroplastic [Tanacetum coccineum]|uniref:50S ribosomal protein L9, chloroplastic n=1 Tax=Tanacetum coccineum TaxID=301880 RepID=A0ABQ5B6K8_9ASTR